MQHSFADVPKSYGFKDILLLTITKTVKNAGNYHLK